MKTLIAQIWGVGDRTSRFFHLAELFTVQDLHDKACGQRVQEAINKLKNEEQDYEEVYWKAMGTRCEDVILRARSIDAKQIDPEHLLCPISAELFKNPVIAPSGYSYEKSHIEFWLQKNNTDPMTRSKLSKDQLYDNKSLKDAIQNYKLYYRQYSMFK